MAIKEFGVNDNLSNKLWAAKFLKETAKFSWFGRFMGEGEENIIQLKTETSKQPGDKITCGLVIQLAGDGTRRFEVAGADMGNVEASNNSSLAQLIVGSNTTTTDLLLVDLIDNGNRASPETLYLLGSGGLDGLQILNGSTLTIGDIPVYAKISGVMTDLRSLFPVGQMVISFTEPGSNGFIAIPEPTMVGVLAIGLLAAARRRRT